MNRVAVALGLTCALAVSGRAFQTTPLTLPALALPPGLTTRGAGGSGGIAEDFCRGAVPGRSRPPEPADLRGMREVEPSAHAWCRLKPAMDAGGIAEHYKQQFTAAGWRVTFAQTRPSFAVIRLASNGPDDPVVGLLTVVPFPAMQNVVVTIDLMRTRTAWTAAGRTGGGGAGSAADFDLDLRDGSDSEVLFPKAMRLPADVRRVGFRTGGGSVDFSQDGMRLQTLMAPAALMKRIEPQVTAAGWAADDRASDPILAITKFNPPPKGDSTAVLMLTSMPGPGDMAFILNVVRNR